jgi:hypothetical protein
LFPDVGLNQSFRDRMTALGYNPDNATSTAATVGTAMANKLMSIRRNDGSNQLNGYADTTGYAPVNSATNVTDIARWTPENVPIGDPSGSTQSALHPHWGNVTTFALTSSDQFLPPAPQPFLLDSNATADLAARTITRADGTVVPINRAAIGVDINPAFMSQTEAVVDQSAMLGQAGGDERKLIAEFWEDPGSTPYPPGT